MTSFDLRSLGDSTPIDSASQLWALQMFLINEAEKRLGYRTSQKTILPPSFENRGPYILNIKDDAGNYTQAHAVLGRKAFNNWSVALFELAHETIHLLDPIIGCTNYLEEGIAVTFSIDMAKQYAEYDKLPENRNYLEACELVQSLPGGPYASAKIFRENYGALSNAKPDKLNKLFPTLESTSIDQLCEKFNG